jgi:hypothetical protein
MRALVTAIDFIEHGTDDIIHPDYAIKILEHIAANLDALPSEALTELHGHFQTLACEYEDPEMQEFVRNTLPLMGVFNA